MITKHDIVNKTSIASFHVAKALNMMRTFAGTRAGDEVIGHLQAAKGQFIEIDGSIEYADLMDKT